METAIIKTRRPWLAALLSLLGHPVGQIYAGRFRRAIVLWVVGSLLLPLLTLSFIALPTGRLGMGVLLLCVVSFPFYLAIDAFLLATRNRHVPLKHYQRWWIYVLALGAFAAASSGVAYTVRSFLAEAFVVPTRSMSPTIQPGDRVLVDKLWYATQSVERNDVVVFHSEGPDSPLFVMRVVGLPGDTIELSDEQVILNGSLWDDQYAAIDHDLRLSPELANYAPITIPADSFFVLGDNRRRSMDSRILGPIPLADLHGKARMIYWSHERRFPDPWNTSQYESGPIRWERIGTRLD